MILIRSLCFLISVAWRISILLVEIRMILLIAKYNVTSYGYDEAGNFCGECDFHGETIPFLVFTNGQSSEGPVKLAWDFVRLNIKLYEFMESFSNLMFMEFDWTDEDLCSFTTSNHMIITGEIDMDWRNYKIVKVNKINLS